MYLYIINLLEYLSDAIYQIIIDWKKEEDDGEGGSEKVFTTCPCERIIMSLTDPTKQMPKR
jgi:hypothetical protein